MSNPPNTPMGTSLHIGLNYIDPKHYNGWDGKLIAPENDAKDMLAIAKSQGFNTTLLLREDATRKNIINYISNSSKKLKEGDFFLISYSGHGGKVADLNGDESDSTDETWCLYDAQLIDDELSLLWQSFKKGVRIFIVSDSCHSGTIAKKFMNQKKYSTQRKKFAPDEIALSTYVKNKDFYDSISLKKDNPTNIKATVRTLSACQDNQYAYDGFFNSIFTERLKEVWNGGNFKKDYAAFHKAILNLLPAHQSPRHSVIGIPNKRYDEERPFTI